MRTRGTTSLCNLKRVRHSVGAIGTDPCVVVSVAPPLSPPLSFSCSRSHSLSLSLLFPKDDVDPSSQMSPNTGGAYGKSSCMDLLSAHDSISAAAQSALRRALVAVAWLAFPCACRSPRSLLFFPRRFLVPALRRPSGSSLLRRPPSRISGQS